MTYLVPKDKSQIWVVKEVWTTDYLHLLLIDFFIKIKMWRGTINVSEIYRLLLLVLYVHSFLCVCVYARLCVSVTWKLKCRVGLIVISSRLKYHNNLNFHKLVSVMCYLYYYLSKSRTNLKFTPTIISYVRWFLK